jgi:hypothetical protein
MDRSETCRRALAFGLIALAAVGCGGSTGPEPVSYPASGRGDDASRAPFDVGGWTVVVEEARIGFGPLYLCASVAASPELCSTAVAELAESVEIDATVAGDHTLGEIRGASGTVQSALYDFAITWLREGEPRVLDAAPGGHSAVLAVVAQRNGRVLRVRAELDVRPQQVGAHAVQQRLPETPQHSALSLEITFPIAAWWGRVDFDGLALFASDEVVLPPATAPLPATPDQEPSLRAAVSARSALLGAITSTDRPQFRWRGL